MNNSAKILAGTLAAAGLVTYLLATNKNKKKVNKIKKDLTNEVQSFVATAEDKVSLVKSDAKDKIAEQVFDFAVSNRKMIGNLAGYVLPYLLKGYVKKKF